MIDLIYPTKDKIIELNFLVLTLIKVKKADTAEVLSPFKISKTIDECKDYEGDLYDKGAVLMRELVKGRSLCKRQQENRIYYNKILHKRKQRKV